MLSSLMLLPLGGWVGEFADGWKNGYADGGASFAAIRPKLQTRAGVVTLSSQGGSAHSQEPAGTPFGT